MQQPLQRPRLSTNENSQSQGFVTTRDVSGVKLAAQHNLQ